MGRSPNTISDELRRNRVRGSYDPAKAQHKAYAKRKYAKYQGMKIVHNDSLRKEVCTRLLDDQSPEAIAGYMRRNKILPSISKNSIYRYIASVYGRRIETHRLLKRQKRRHRRVPCAKLPGVAPSLGKDLHISTQERVSGIRRLTSLCLADWGKVSFWSLLTAKRGLRSLSGYVPSPSRIWRVHSCASRHDFLR